MKGPKDPTSGHAKRERRSPDLGAAKHKIRTGLHNVTSIARDLLGRNSNSRPESHERSAQSRTNGGSLLDDDQYEAFFAPKFGNFAKYIKDIRTLKNNQKQNRNSLLGSLEGLDEKIIGKKLNPR